MTWNEVLADPCLQDLPYKIELNEWGEVVMSPAMNWHGTYQSRLVRILSRQISGGEVIVECSVETSKGVKVSDVVWCSDEFLAKYEDLTPFPTAPELCIEVVSGSNSLRQMREKIKLYFEQGAVECWLVIKGGEVQMFNAHGLIPTSSFGVAVDVLER